MTHTLDSYGGTNQLKGKSTGWFHLEELGGRRWFITPEGNAFFPVSLAHIYTGNSQPTVQKLHDGDKEAWIEKWFGQMRGLGFNCALAGVTSQCRDPQGYVEVEKVEALFRRESFPYTVGLFLIPHPNELPKGQERPDIFTPAYQDWVEELVADVCSRYTDDPMMMGYYYGFGTFIRPQSWIDSIPSLDSEAPEQENIRNMAVHLYRMVHDAIGRHDPNHLILGPYVKEQSFDIETWKALTPYVDMLSPQHFNRDSSFAEQSAATGRAVLVSDEESGHIFAAARQNPRSVTSENKGRVYSLLLDRHLRDANVCGVNFCATLYDLDDGPLMDKMGMMEGLYDWDGNAKPGLADVVREANKEFYERATQPYGSDRLSELDATLCRARDEVHKHVR